MTSESTQHANHITTQRSTELCTAAETKTTLSSGASSDEQDSTVTERFKGFPGYDEAFQKSAGQSGTQVSPTAKEVLEEDKTGEELFEERDQLGIHCMNLSTGHDSQVDEFTVKQTLHKQYGVNAPDQEHSSAEEEEEEVKTGDPASGMVTKDHFTEDIELQHLPATDELFINHNIVKQIIQGLPSIDEGDQQSLQVTHQKSQGSDKDAVQVREATEDSSRNVEKGDISENGRTEADSMANERTPGLTPQFFTERYSTIGSEEHAAIQQLMNMIDCFDYDTPEDQAALDPVEQSSSISVSLEKNSLFGDSDLESPIDDRLSFDDDLKQHWMFGNQVKVSNNKVVPSLEQKSEHIDVVLPAEGVVEKPTGTRNSIQHPPERGDSILPILAGDDITYPEGGLDAWLVVFGGWCGMFASLGLISTLGSFQTYYLENTLNQYTPSQVGWIFSTFTFLTFGCSLYVGPLFDYYGPRWIIFTGSLLLTIMMFSLPYCNRK